FFTGTNVLAYSGRYNEMQTGYAYGGGIEYAIPTDSFLNRFNFIGSLLGKLFAGLLAMVGLGVALDPLVAMLTGMATLGVAIVGGP
ncbi:hypothetical protein, partial [Halomonas sp. ND22Bw]|uniref:hypothetical protein n=1 Tax=Halomonas sp. ND22Bw TaxID=2054178 RepID=UPI001C62EF7E